MGNSKSSRSLDVTTVPKNVKGDRKSKKASPPSKPVEQPVAEPTPARIADIIATPVEVPTPAVFTTVKVSTPSAVTTTAAVSTPAAVTTPAVVSETSAVPTPSAVPTSSAVPTPAVASTTSAATTPADVSTTAVPTSAAVSTPADVPKQEVISSPSVVSTTTVTTNTSSSVATASTIAPPTTTSKDNSINNDNAAAKVAASKMPVTVYYAITSPPSRATRMTARVIGLDVNSKLIDLNKGEHQTPEYTKLNPARSVPALEDNGFVINESRAILSYLVDAYAKDDSLYPKDPQARALVDQRLYFDIGTFYKSYVDYYIPFVLRGVPLDPEKLRTFEKALGLLNTFLEGHQFVAGDHLTIADISFIPTISNLDAFDFDLSQYPNIHSWYGRVKKALAPFGYEEINQTGADIFGKMYKSKLG